MDTDIKRIAIEELITDMLKDEVLRKKDPAPYLNACWAVESDKFQRKLRKILED